MTLERHWYSYFIFKIFIRFVQQVIPDFFFFPVPTGSTFFKGCASDTGGIAHAACTGSWRLKKRLFYFKLMGMNNQNALGAYAET